MPIHLKISPEDLSPYVLLPGDPGRTKIIAEKFLTQVKRTSDYRGLLSYTGKYKNVPVSVVTTGMGCPSGGIVVEELASLGAKVLIRVGTCGGVSEKVNPADLIIPQEAIPLV
jgi:purine-nucleoside phosphorylase